MNEYENLHQAVKDAVTKEEWDNKMAEIAETLKAVHAASKG